MCEGQFITDDLAAYAAAMISLFLQVASMGGKSDADAVEKSLSEDGRTVQLLVEVRPDAYAIASFDLPEPMTEDAFYEKWVHTDA